MRRIKIIAAAGAACDSDLILDGGETARRLAIDSGLTADLARTNAHVLKIQQL